jgi:hypothetical protein
MHAGICQADAPQCAALLHGGMHMEMQPGGRHMQQAEPSAQYSNHQGSLGNALAAVPCRCLMCRASPVCRRSFRASCRR